MSGTYERAGKPKLPKWWTDIVWPIIDGKDIDRAELAKKASEHMGRKSPWKSDAISKFRSGVAVTRELANGISKALGEPQPYFEARSPAESRAMEHVQVLHDAASGIARLDPGTISRRSRVLGAMGRMVEDEQGQSTPVESKNERSPRGLGHRSASAGRQKTARNRS